MTESELLEIESRANAATPGPWLLGDWNLCYNSLGDCIAEAHFDQNDNTFIAKARTDVPRLVDEVRRLKLLVHQQELTGLGAVVLVAEIERLKADIERSRTTFVWKSNASWSWGLYSKDVCFDTVEMRQTERGELWTNTFYCGYFDTLDEARAWVETRLRDSGVIKPIDVAEVRQ